jgi:hypothetical protein
MDLPKNVIAFDCDGTISLSGGNVTPEQLAILTSHGNIVVIVSPSGACVSLPYPRIVDGATRLDNLKKVKTAFPGDNYYYVSDNPGDDQVSKEAGFTYIHPSQFNQYLFR